MALINCPECGKEISNRAGACPNCGCPIGEVSNPLQEKNAKIQQVEVTGIKVKRKTRMIVVVLIILLLAAIGGFIGYKKYNEMKVEQEYQQAFNLYIDDLQEIRAIMLVSGGEAEKLCNLTSKVWYNTIHKIEDKETNIYSKRTNSSFFSDFGVAVDNLYADDDTINTLSNISSSVTMVKEYMKGLQYPPEGLDKCYDTVMELYEEYNALTSLAMSPSGSYNEYSSKLSESASEFMLAYEKLENLIPVKFSETK